LDLDKPTYKSI